MSEKECGTVGIAAETGDFSKNQINSEDGIDNISSENWPCYVSEMMDRLGYSYEMIKYRQQIMDETCKLENNHDNVAYTVVTMGGTGEGTTLFYENDVDRMFIVKDVICADNPLQYFDDENITLFQTDTRDTSPGYTRLKLLKLDGKPYEEEIISSLFEDETGSHYLSSQFLNDAMRALNTETDLRDGLKAEPMSGPSTPVTDNFISFDQVYCFRCVCPDLIEGWVSRPRCKGWPTPEFVNEVSLLDGHVVPVGFKGSENMYKEWRICYSLAELNLMKYLKETQVKVYILLKNLARSALKPVCKDMTSYIMKNVILLMSEENGVEAFMHEMIMDRLVDCLQFLRKSIDENNLPSYMIPDRNLLVGRVDDQQKHQLTSVLTGLLHEGRGIICRCFKFRDALTVMYKTPSLFKEQSEKRDKLERLVLMLTRLRAEGWVPGMSVDENYRLLWKNEQYCHIVKNISHLIQFDRKSLKQAGKTDEEINDLFNSKLSQLLS